MSVWMFAGAMTVVVVLWTGPGLGLITPAAIHTSPHSNVTPVTVAPAERINYTLVLTNDGPVVLDAQLTFTASLLDHQGKIAQSKLFRYDWNNNADKNFHSTKGDFVASYNRQFRSDSTKSGRWVMTVAVYGGKEYSDMINFGSMEFALTEYLNGRVHVNQTLEYQRQRDTFSTGKVIRLYANLTDKFPDRPGYEYFWFKDNHFLRATEDPHCDLNVAKEENFTIHAQVHALFDPFPPLISRGERNLRPLNAEPCSEGTFRTVHSPLSSKKPRRYFDISEKCGILSQRVSVKEPLKTIDVDGDLSAGIGQYISVNITCNGSYPTSVCWNVTALNTSEPSSPTCPPAEFLSTCNHQVSIKLTNLGWSTVQFTVYNDVSYMSSSFNVYAFNQDSVNVPALTIPIVFCTIGIVIVIVGTIYLNKLRKKPTIEVADFDFHPSMSTEGAGNYLSRLANKMKLIWFRNKYSKKHTNPDFQETTAKQYGATDDYESL
ncbi:uncharacterized protein LOC124153088 [Haliotis rufescens]|uniref:uncharacterized protein LOC124153088 n=1 Tax=Haliotis rufescens TaxID=6454 RepID=UPI001EAFF9AA|nr:uncharacterized protein LOC124153088 [Haliotis rufescens]